MKSICIFSIGFTLCVSFLYETNQEFSFSHQTSVNSQFDTEEFYACPRCRRAEPKGPRKLPTPPATHQIA